MVVGQNHENQLFCFDNVILLFRMYFRKHNNRFIARISRPATSGIPYVGFWIFLPLSNCLFVRRDFALESARGGNTVKTLRKFVVGILVIFICLVVLGVPFSPYLGAIACVPIFLIFGTMGLSALIAKKTRIGVWKIMFLLILIFLAFGYLRWFHAPIYELPGLFIGSLPFVFIVWVGVEVGVSLGRKKPASLKFIDWFFGRER
jgi:FtsH-binding integral membrane protein